MSRYATEFTKEGYIKYISHLDLMRLFQRAFKKADIRLKHSQGYNPHPKIGVAQPLSLGYLSTGEILEFETIESIPTNLIKHKLAEQMPSGIEILNCNLLPEEGKTLAALADAAEYKIMIPENKLSAAALNKIVASFLGQDQMPVKKLQRKSGKETEINIKPMIRSLETTIIDNNIIMTTLLDSGSNSNLSPELLITAFLAFSGIVCNREDMEVMRTKIYFSKN